MKKLLIASSVLATLAMANVANAGPGVMTENGGTIEFIGEIADTTCFAEVDGNAENGTAGTTNSTTNLVLLPTVAKNLLDGAVGRTAGRTNFGIAVRADVTTGTNACVLGAVASRDVNGVPTGASKPVSKVKAIFGGSLTSADKDSYRNVGNGYNAGDLNNVDMASGYLKNLASVAGAPNNLRTFDNNLNSANNGGAEGVQLRLLDKNLNVVKVGDATYQMANNVSQNITTGIKTVLPYYVEYISADTTVVPGMVRAFVTYDLHYE